MFKFAFNVEIDNENPFSVNIKESGSDQTSENVGKDGPEEWYTAEKVVISSEILENLDVYKLNATTLNVGDLPIHHVVTGFLLQHITSNSGDNKDISKAEQTHSDLIPGVYEGGAKIWECTEDLLKYLAKNFKPQSWRGKRVLDLGCGAGLLGIYAYRCGAIVHFQDYNKDVLTQITIPNVLLNVVDVKPAKDNSNSEDATESKVDLVNTDDLGKNVEFYSGDWSKYSELTSESVECKSDKFDYILASETIYNPKNQQKLLDTFYVKLKPDGVVLVAAKTYYFGVGGGLRQFETLIANDKRFQSNVVWTSTDGVGREILELKLSEQ
ncbi:PREDICTED: histidine protein methyltransferase 1 homolog [Rhagoletis zephyria]|uniref:histidine protein methyltransferase 1 homolog n=1 Tax=Rhagoletis zephyria TaxID=28612 RepID=UPI0008119C30|nr:PREDICTED: histidine protein methyltransferase 1 homolog [Rhagoletis zephyria]